MPGHGWVPAPKLSVWGPALRGFLLWDRLNLSSLAPSPPPQARQRMAHGWFSWWICGTPMWRRPNGRLWISSSLQDDEEVPVLESVRVTAVHPGVRARPLVVLGSHAPKPASTESPHLGSRDHAGSLFPLINVNGKFSACISLGLFFFSFQSFAPATPLRLIAHYFAPWLEARRPVLAAPLLGFPSALKQSDQTVICLNVIT